ncbi:uncharacterized protein LOC126992843 [Eriocheir sinensis]|uniref:uncharacterized protein LOC126992843 n=1 Tax=Eriocheir sinensis TaxID=95602 RepID=UPI0021C80DB3|nr:uncharacterized protein LOC126992843 [Eriocheir sinensis]
MPEDCCERGVASFRGPTFTSHEPTLWFTILEVNFKPHRITTSLTKFSHATALIPLDVLSQVSDTISKAASSDTPYEDLKAAILSRLEPSVTTRLQEMLSKEELGNEKPSDLLRRMKRLLGEKYESFDKEVFSHLFYQRLPPHIQQGLFTVKNTLSLEGLAKLADDFLASSPAAPQPTVSSVADTTGVQQLAALVSQLSLEVSALKEEVRGRPRRRSPSPHPHRRRSRSDSRPRRTPGVCYYHNRFGRDARKCTSPCTFQDSLNSPGGH